MWHIPEDMLHPKPVSEIFPTLILPSWDPEVSISESLLNTMQKTASSCITLDNPAPSQNAAAIQPPQHMQPHPLPAQAHITPQASTIDSRG